MHFNLLFMLFDLIIDLYLDTGKKNPYLYSIDPIT